MEGKGLPALGEGTACLVSVLLAASTIIILLHAPISAASGAGAIQGESPRELLSLDSNYSSTTSTATQNSTSPGAIPGFNCGYNNAQNSSRVVASSPAGGEIQVTVGEPSWLQICTSYGNVGESFPAYEVFPVTVYAAPGTSFTLGIGHASHTPEQIAQGMLNNTIWTGFDPVNVTTDAEGVARSNFTLAGAVMPFVPNDIANVSLPIIARSPNGAQAAAGLPIEFSGSEAGGIDVIHVMTAPGPILFPGTMQGSASNPTQYAYGIVYAPPASDNGAEPIHVILSVAGSWKNGAVGEMPAGVQVTISQPSFTLYPNQVLYFFVDENNGVLRTMVPSTSDYTIAIKENVGGSSFVEPLSVSVSTSGLFASFGAFRTDVSGARSWFYIELASAATAAIVAMALAATYLRRKKQAPAKEGAAGDPDTTSASPTAPSATATSGTGRSGSLGRHPPPARADNTG